MDGNTKTFNDAVVTILVRNLQNKFRAVILFHTIF